MKITKITQTTSEVIDTDEDFYPTYRRHSPDNWENLMGEAWEPVYGCEELEALYQAARPVNPFKRYFAINKLTDDRWSVENLAQIDLTMNDIIAINQIVITWLRIRVSLLKGGEKQHDTDSNKIKNG